ncbi:MAG: DUF2200 domain-containing protein [Demequina sp.]|uniref:DUF2200 domain-containing protein n=1 Tax=Demequina sp. TaxID=2050685 RepID=UPI003A896C4D
MGRSIGDLTFSSVYPLYIQKVERKGRTQEELDEVITWLTGFTKERIDAFAGDQSTFRDFFDAATLNPNAGLIRGVICGYRVEDIEDPLTQRARYLDKLVDELARGKAMEKIKRA